MTSKHAGKLMRGLGVAIVGIVAVTSARADILLVPDDYGTIQAAINAAVNGDEVVVADGIYSGVGNKNPSSHRNGTSNIVAELAIFYR